MKHREFKRQKQEETRETREIEGEEPTHLIEFSREEKSKRQFFGQ